MNLTEHKMKLKSTFIDKNDDGGNAPHKHLKPEKSRCTSSVCHLDKIARHRDFNERFFNESAVIENIFTRLKIFLRD